MVFKAEIVVEGHRKWITGWWGCSRKWNLIEWRKWATVKHLGTSVGEEGKELSKLNNVFEVVQASFTC